MGRIIARPAMVKEATSTGSLAQAFLRKAASLAAILVSEAARSQSPLGIVVRAREAPLTESARAHWRKTPVQGGGESVEHSGSCGPCARGFAE